MRPLDGITIVALEHVIAAPFATRQLADLGARVIKIERPGAGDFARHYDERAKGMSSHFTWVNRSKESLTLDLKQEGALIILKQLLQKADVFVQNLAPGAAARGDAAQRRAGGARPGAHGVPGQPATRRCPIRVRAGRPALRLLPRADGQPRPGHGCAGGHPVRSPLVVRLELRLPYGIRAS